MLDYTENADKITKILNWEIKQRKRKKFQYIFQYAIIISPKSKSENTRNVYTKIV